MEFCPADIQRFPAGIVEEQGADLQLEPLSSHIVLLAGLLLHHQKDAVLGNFCCFFSVV